MKFFSQITKEILDTLFYQKPQPFTKHSPKETLQFALGATLYIPATLPNIKERLFSPSLRGLSSAVICLEDAISDVDVKEAEEKLIFEIREIHRLTLEGQIEKQDIPLLFVRVRSVEQLKFLLEELDDASAALTGIAIPKFSSFNGYSYFELIKAHNKTKNSLYALPILESKALIYKETRNEELFALYKMFNTYRDVILNLRVGATDFSGLYGIRRNVHTSVYDISIIRDVLSDIVNFFGREDNYFTISAPVWEFFNKHSIDFGTTHEEVGLIREVQLDLVNGFTGKTIIHPSQIFPIQALQVVTYEEYIDACTIIKGSETQNGVMKSEYSNKMNECKPHLFWAKKILMKSKVYGVLYEQRTYNDLLSTATNISNSKECISKG
ncbi:HpcH/HpaI aldolase/citrate lyase family protein [Bacillus carboniphilus]|uniref:HpcH/HpaI aldolase/citrate lyase family protein n=1 Tax=Bacillus carboniphilus TaxID=86663 RepID=A0ABP3GPF0_9BACI